MRRSSLSLPSSSAVSVISAEFGSTSLFASSVTSLKYEAFTKFIRTYIESTYEFNYLDDWYGEIYDEFCAWFDEIRSRIVNKKKKDSVSIAALNKNKQPQPQHEGRQQDTTYKKRSAQQANIDLLTDDDTECDEENGDDDDDDSVKIRRSNRVSKKPKKLTNESVIALGTVKKKSKLTTSKTMTTAKKSTQPYSRTKLIAKIIVPRIVLSDKNQQQQQSQVPRINHELRTRNNGASIVESTKASTTPFRVVKKIDKSRIDTSCLKSIKINQLKQNEKQQENRQQKQQHQQQQQHPKKKIGYLIDSRDVESKTFKSKVRLRKLTEDILEFGKLENQSYSANLIEKALLASYCSIQLNSKTTKNQLATGADAYDFNSDPMLLHSTMMNAKTPINQRIIPASLMPTSSARKQHPQFDSVRILRSIELNEFSRCAGSVELDDTIHVSSNNQQTIETITSGSCGNKSQQRQFIVSKLKSSSSTTYQCDFSDTLGTTFNNYLVTPLQPARLKDEDNYDVSELSSCDDDEDDSDYDDDDQSNSSGCGKSRSKKNKKQIPRWANPEQIKLSMMDQTMKGVNVEKIFQSAQEEHIDLAKLFPKMSRKKKLDTLKRSSSVDWTARPMPLLPSSSSRNNNNESFMSDNSSSAEQFSFMRIRKKYA